MILQPPPAASSPCSWLQRHRRHGRLYELRTALGRCEVQVGDLPAGGEGGWEHRRRQSRLTARACIDCRGRSFGRKPEGEKCGPLNVRHATAGRHPCTCILLVGRPRPYRSGVLAVQFLRTRPPPARHAAHQHLHCRGLLVGPGADGLGYAAHRGVAAPAQHISLGRRQHKQLRRSCTGGICGCSGCYGCSSRG